MAEQKEEGRIFNSARNLMFAFIGQLLTLILQFGIRTVFINTLGKEYLGLNGLFSNIMQFLSLAELGVGAAITFSLYEPIAKQDEEKIIVLMKLFRKAYCVIGIVILCIGISLTPFLNFFVKEMPDISNIKIIYLLNVLSSAMSYFYSYKSTFIIANQKNYIVTNNRYIINLISIIFRCISLFIWNNYMIYLIIQIFFVFAENVSISIQADKLYPVLKKKTDKRLDDETKKAIIDDVAALITHRIGAIVVFSTDNLLISKLFGVITVGLYSNYSLLITAIESIVGHFFNAVIAGVGNLRFTADKEKQYDTYKVIFFINYIIYSFCITAFAVLIQPFIKIWLGDDFLMSNLCVSFILINFFIKGMRQTNIMFNSTYELMKYYKFMPIPEIIINLLVSILLSKYIGVVGIFMGTTVSTVCTCLWIEPRVLAKYGLNMKLKDYFFKYCLYLILTGVILSVTYYIASFITLIGVSGFIIKVFIVAVVPNTLNFMIFRKTNELKVLIDIIKGFINIKKHHN